MYQDNLISKYVIAKAMVCDWTFSNVHSCFVISNSILQFFCPRTKIKQQNDQKYVSLIKAMLIHLQIRIFIFPRTKIVNSKQI